MWQYWMLFAIAAVPALAERRKSVTERAARGSQLAMLTALVFFAIVIGLRYRVGGDWEPYLERYMLLRGTELMEALEQSDPGYQLIAWLAYQLGLGIDAVNLIAAIIFCAGLGNFCRSLPRPWLALAVAVPYLIVVVAMGYTRQAVALGLCMMGLPALASGRTFRFAIWVLIGATFHKSAVLLLPVAGLVNSRRPAWTWAWLVLFMGFAFSAFLEDSLETLYAGYIDAEYQSEGAFIRLAMNAFAAALLLLFRRRFHFDAHGRPIWTWFAVISLALLAALFFTNASTALDRVGLYMLPLQLVVFSHLPDVLARQARESTYSVLLVLGYFALAQFVWLTYATHAVYWVPYQFYY